MADRKPKPTALKELEGNPEKRKLNKKEPKPDKGMPTRLEWLLLEAKQEWKRLCEKHNKIYHVQFSNITPHICRYRVSTNIYVGMPFFVSMYYN